ncbi:MAG: hypothetical protein IPK82_09840 [Polyangiaceae bacterium]|nr:hypothetical protein [Polyangiaceae bacterium]
MKSDISDGYLRLLHRGLVHIRYACQSGDIKRAEAIADALHNLPLSLKRPDELSGFVAMYLEPLVCDYPDLAELRGYVASPDASLE